MRTKGKIVLWNDEKGFGFIAPSAGGKQVFVHVKSFGNRNRRPEINQLVTYGLSTDMQGRARAINATLAGDRLPQEPKGNNDSMSIPGAFLFIIAVGVSVLLAKVPPEVFVIYLVVSLMAFIVYAVDKSAAKKGVRRTQESTLHLLSLAGGWPGALVAQRVLRHKTQKKSFRATFWVTVLLNCGLFAWLFTPSGSAALQSLIA